MITLDVEAAEKRIRADERERCARVAADRAAIWRREGFDVKANEAANIAAEIRELKSE